METLTSSYKTPIFLSLLKCWRKQTPFVICMSMEPNQIQTILINIKFTLFGPEQRRQIFRQVILVWTDLIFFFFLQLISSDVEGVGGKQFTQNLLNTFDLDMSRMAIFDYRYISRFNFFLSLAFNQSQYYPIWTILFYISIELKPQSLTSFLQLRRIEDIRSFHDDWSWGIFQVQDDLSCDWWSDYQATNWQL